MNQLLPFGLIAVALLAFWYLRRPDISSAKAHELVAAGARLVDVRSPGEFAAGHVDGARNVPVGEIAGRVKELGPTDGPVILYCASGMRSAAAKRTLKSAGFSNVYNLGPMSNW